MSPIGPVGATPPGNEDLAALAGSLSSSADAEQIKDAAKQFESIFLAKIIGEMFDSAGVGKDLPSGYRSMMEEKFADYMSDAGGLGLQAVLATQMSGNVPGATAPVAGQDGATTAPSGEGTGAQQPADGPPDTPTP